LLILSNLKSDFIGNASIIASSFCISRVVSFFD
jgi:hypothetical protein